MGVLAPLPAVQGVKSSSMADSPFLTPDQPPTSALDLSVDQAAEPAVGSSSVLIIPPQPGEVITSEATGNTYTMGEKIGEGNFGLVYGCMDVWNNSLAAKVMKPMAPYEKLKESTVAELQKLIHLRHPHITYVYDAFEYRETFYIITERCSGPVYDLFKLENFDGFSWIKAIARCLLQAVHFLHTNGFVHQDIHGGNVLTTFIQDEMVPSDSAIQFKLGDLGVAKFFTDIDARNTRAQWMLPPEVLSPNDYGPIDYRIDIYHCGLLFLQIAYGSEVRFTQDEILHGKPRDLAVSLPAPYCFALEKALRRHVSARTADAMEFWRDLSSPGENVQPLLEAPGVEPQTKE
jgi:serine/threonine-protein kinase